MTDASSARTTVASILVRDGLVNLDADDVDRLVALYSELQPDLAQLRSPELRGAEPAVIFSAE